MCNLQEVRNDMSCKGEQHVMLSGSHVQVNNEV